VDDDFDVEPKSRRLYHLFAALAIIGGTITLCTGFFFLMSPMVAEKAARMSSTSNMKQLALAAHNSNDSMDEMPGPFVDGEMARTIPEDPTLRLSWRVALLPYIEASHLYSDIALTEAWDSPTNRPVTNTHYRPFADPLDGKSTLTPYRVFYDNGALWDTDPKRRVALDKIPDDAANTIMIAESTAQVPWAQFNEHPYSPDGPLPELGRATRNTFLVAMADGSVRSVKKTVAPHILRAAVTRDGGEPVGPDFR
jgi:Protein of unknown function (DUF1559)